MRRPLLEESGNEEEMEASEGASDDGMDVASVDEGVAEAAFMPKGMHRVEEVLEARGRGSKRTVRVRWGGVDASGAADPSEWIPLADLSADLRGRWKDPFARHPTPVARASRTEVAKARALEEERMQEEEAARRGKEHVDREARAGR